jgi:hypothetical protein
MELRGVSISGLAIGGGQVVPPSPPSPNIGPTTSTQTPTSGSGTSISALTGVSSPTTPFPGFNVNAYNLNNSVNGYFTVPASSSWAFGTGDFTIEWFQYQTDSNSFPRIFAIGTYPSTTIGCSIEGTTFYAWASNPYSFGSATPYKNAWVHFAIVRSASTLRVYKNGTAMTAGTANITNINNTSTVLTFGNETSRTSGAAFGGYLTGIRICKGLAVYTGNFTKPTSPLGQTASANPYGGSNTSAITNQCVLLLNP